MLASPRHKRPRSPSPSLESSDLTSPLDVFLKRRRRHDSDSYHDNSLPLPFTAGPPPSEPHMVDGEDSAESSLTPWHRFVEKRRTRQWERQNAPQPLPSQTLSQPHLAPSSNSYPDVPSSQPTSSSSSDPLSPAPGQRWHSQPEPRQHANAQMSSSPIRHHPPTSSPFRPGPSSEVTRVEEWMDPEEMRREWGEEYAAQNSLLHSLHMARRSVPPSTGTPDQTLLQTPSLPSPSPPHSHLCPTPYRTSYFPSSSPFTSQPHAQFTPKDDGDGLGGIGMDLEPPPEYLNDEVDTDGKKRYEETNRLLAELEVVRRRRWGEV